MSPDPHSFLGHPALLALAGWVLTYLLHSSLLLGVALVLVRAAPRAHPPAFGETVLKMAAFGASRAAARAMTKISTGGNSCWCSLKHSRTARFTRLRRTALPIALVLTAMPRRAWPRSFAR